MTAFGRAGRTWHAVASSPTLAGVAALLVPAVALARHASSNSSYSDPSTDSTRTLLGIIGVVVMIGLFLVWANVKSKVTVTRGDGSVDAESSSSTQSGAAAVRKGPPRANVGRSTAEYGFLEGRNNAVLALKQKYGNAVRIVHRGKTGYGYSEKWILVTEIPAKCPQCKEAFSVDDWGLLDCPGCGQHLAVVFHEQKKMVYVVTGVNDDGTFSVSLPTTSSARKSRAKPAEPSPVSATQPELAENVQNRFSKISPKA